MNENETLTFEERVYENPTTSRDAQLSFIDTLRETMADKQNQVNQSTYALGAQIPARYGGLQGGEQTFQARYRTPQLEQTAANLRAAAQQSALNTALSNLQSAWKKRYNDAITAYQKRAAVAATTPVSTSTSTSGDGGINFEEIVEGVIDQDSLLPDGTPNAVVSGPPGTTATSPDGDYTDYRNEAGETVRHYNDGRIEVIKNGQITSAGTSRESVNDAITRLESQGKTVTNKRIQADDQGNVTLTWRDKEGKEGSEVIKVNLNYRGAGLF